MENLKKIREYVKRYISPFLFVLFITVPAFASLQKGESLLLEGKIDETLTTLSPLVAKNDPHALYLTAMIHLSPTFNHFNFKKGLELLEKAVFQNYTPALDELAGLYLAGEGVEKNEKKALHYYIQASHLGYGPSQFNCGIMYKEGQGTEQDPVKAYFYLCLASLNYKDLEGVTLHAARYRDEVAPLLSPVQRQEVLRQVNALTLPPKSMIRKEITP